MTKLSERLKFYSSLTEDFLKKHTESFYTNKDFSGYEDCVKNIFDSFSYSLFAGGKRLRPFLVLEFASIFGADINEAVSYAAAIESVHTFSLIHDDLPCMDNDDLRRGKPTNHIVFGEACALLAGDALSLYAFEEICDNSFSAKQNMRAAKLLASSAGICGMIAGQQIDIFSEGKKADEKLLTLLQQKKTGALFECAVLLGCIAANIPEDDKRYIAAKRFASHIGLAFQITDDILDVCGNEQTLGKPIGSDSENEKSTFVSLVGIDGAKKKAELEIEKAKAELLKTVPEEKLSVLFELADYIVNRNK